MGGDRVQIIIAMALYIAAVIGIGVFYAKKANESSDNFLIGGRSLGPWVTAMAAEASDMSGWLLMGLPGLAYWMGLGSAFWTAFGLIVGTYLNWLLVAKRLRNYSHVAGNSITIPDFISNRFKEKNKILLLISAIFILIFFCVYAASCFVTVGKLFSTLFDTKYVYMMIIGAIFVVVYTFVGGFLAESASDFMQGIVMFISLTAVLIFGVVKAGGISEVIDNAKQIPGFFEFFGVATPQVARDGTQLLEAGKPAFGARAPYGFLSVISAMAWGLGYFGMPHVLLKFMAIRDAKELKTSRRIATVWCVISLGAAVGIGLLGRILFPAAFLTETASESIFVHMSKSFFPALLAGIVMAGILAATISSSDSYLLVSASALSKNIYQSIFKKNAKDKEVLLVSRITLIVVAIIAMLIALNENSVIFKIVSFAWAGFGATFGPLILFSLFWKRVNRMGALAGMLAGGITVFVWKLVLGKLGGVFGIYELLPAFIISSIAIVVVSLLTKEPSQEIYDEFKAAQAMGNAEAK